jgi:hypothetical protein
MASSIKEHLDQMASEIATLGLVPDVQIISGQQGAQFARDANLLILQPLRYEVVTREMTLRLQYMLVLTMRMSSNQAQHAERWQEFVDSAERLFHYLRGRAEEVVLDMLPEAVETAIPAYAATLTAYETLNRA